MAKRKKAQKLSTYRVTASKRVKAKTSKAARSKARRGLGLKVTKVGG